MLLSLDSIPATLQQHRTGSFEVVLQLDDREVDIWSKLMTGELCPVLRETTTVARCIASNSAVTLPPQVSLPTPKPQRMLRIW